MTPRIVRGDVFQATGLDRKERSPFFKLVWISMYHHHFILVLWVVMLAPEGTVGSGYRMCTAQSI